MHGLETSLVVDRDSAGRLGVSMQAIDNTLSDAFGQRQVSNIYKGLNQYHVILEVMPTAQQDPSALKSIYVPAAGGKLVPLSAFSHYEASNTALSVNHQGVFPAITLSFNLAPGASLGPAVQHIELSLLRSDAPTEHFPGHCAGLSRLRASHSFRHYRSGCRLHRPASLKASSIRHYSSTMPPAGTAPFSLGSPAQI
jgi:multidrug efflux pump subunit AcrB